MRRMTAIPFLLMFLLSNAYAGMTWVEDTITATDLPVGNWFSLRGKNGTSMRTLGGSNGSHGYGVKCANTAEEAMKMTWGYYHEPTPEVYINLKAVPNNDYGWWVNIDNVSMMFRKPASNNIFTMYCLLSPKEGTYNTMSDEIKNADNIGVIFHVNISSVVQPVLSTTGPLDLGDVRRDETVTRPVPVNMGYAGGTDSSKILSGNVSWVLTPAADNPSSLMPVVKKGGIPVESFTVSLTNSQIQNDDFTVSLTGNEYPGAYSWTMNITTTIE